MRVEFVLRYRVVGLSAVMQGMDKFALMQLDVYNLRQDDVNAYDW